jgi:hypothetical protein
MAAKLATSKRAVSLLNDKEKKAVVGYRSSTMRRPVDSLVHPINLTRQFLQT